MLSRSEVEGVLKKAKVRRYGETAEIPGIGKLRVRTLTEGEHVAIASRHASEPHKTRAAMVLLAWVDEAGEPVLTANQLDDVLQTHSICEAVADALDELARECPPPGE